MQVPVLLIVVYYKSGAFVRNQDVRTCDDVIFSLMFWCLDTV